jgi:Icc-related predicted phosphoesterase
MEVKKISRNLHAITLQKDEKRVALLSDIHWDNPKCDRVKLKKHLDYFLENQIPIFINGDLLCLMQGRGDKRGNKSDILPEHNNARYLDSVIDTAVDWWSPYAHLITVIGYGNHETSIIKYQETDVLQRFVDLLNYKNKTQVYTGGYGGWIVFKYKVYDTTTLSKTMKYFHGSAGGGIVTRGAINLTRALEIYENMDIFVMGHIHENSSRNDVRDSIHYNQGKRCYEIEQRHIHQAILGTYKEEYGDGFGGWHIERGAPVKPTGGRILTFDGFAQLDKEGVKNYGLLIDSIKIPL